MKFIWLIFILVFAFNSVFAQRPTEVLKYKAKMGFTNSEDKFEKYKFLENGKKLVIVGKKNVQLWDVENAQQISSISYDTHNYYRGGTLEKIVTLGIGFLFRWASLEVDPNGKWFVAIEEGKGEQKKVVVRDLQTGDVLADLDLGGYPITELFFNGNNIIVLGKKDKITKLAFWDKDSLQPVGNIVVEDYKSHLELNDKNKILIGSGDQKLNWTEMVSRQGSQLKLWNIKTGLVEKEFTATNLIPKEYFHEITLSHDEKAILAKRGKQIFVWDIDGNGLPKLEFTPTNPKEKVELIQVIDGKSFLVRVDGKTRLYEFGGEGKIIREIPNNAPNFVGTIKENRFLVFTGNNEVKLIDVQGTEDSTATIKPAAEKEEVYNGSLVDDGNYWAITRYNKINKTTKTELYNTKNGKIDFEFPFGLGTKTIFTSNRKYMFAETLGKIYVWNFEKQQYHSIPLKFSSSTCESGDTYCTETTSNDEYTALSPNEKFILKYGRYQSAVFDIETGQEIQQFFDADNVEYDKQNKVKSSGILNLQGLPNSKYFLSSKDYYGNWKPPLDSWRVCSSCRTLGLWELSN